VLFYSVIIGLPLSFVLTYLLAQIFHAKSHNFSAMNKLLNVFDPVIAFMLAIICTVTAAAITSKGESGVGSCTSLRLYAYSVNFILIHVLALSIFVLVLKWGKKMFVPQIFLFILFKHFLYISQHLTIMKIRINQPMRKRKAS
jgi:hypothetical protein